MVITQHKAWSCRCCLILKEDYFTLSSKVKTWVLYDFHQHEFNLFLPFTWDIQYPYVAYDGRWHLDKWCLYHKGTVVTRLNGIIQGCKLNWMFSHPQREPYVTWDFTYPFNVFFCFRLPSPLHPLPRYQ